MGAMSRNKGKRGELEIAHILQEHGYPARRSVQFNGWQGEADVIGVEGLHIEVKRVEKLNVETAMEQSRRDAKGNEIPVVFHRRNGKKWLATLSLDDFLNLYQNNNQYYGKGY